MSLSDRDRLARNLRIAREGARVSQAAAGKVVGKTRGTIVNWENPANPAEPDSDEVALLAKRYGLTPRDLRFGDLQLPSSAVVAPPVLTGKGRRSIPNPDEATARGRAEGE